MTNEELSPAELGYRWPAEWEPHEATWLAWPHNCDTWPGSHREMTDEFVRFAGALAERETVHVLAAAELQRRVAPLLPGRGVVFHDMATNDAWVRDYGPTFLQSRENERPAAVCWRYNGWGEKYPPYDLDAAVSRKIVATLGMRAFDEPLVVEGGAIEGNGTATLMTTASCLLAANRNPQHGQRQVESILRARLGCDEILWLPRGELEGDDTDGHIDQLARFVDPQTVVVAVADSAEANAAGLAENADFLRRTSCDVVELPIPPPQISNGQRLPASYCNFYFAEGCVIVPQFDSLRADERALGVLGDLLPGRDIVGLPTRQILAGLGAFHCLTQQQPCSPSKLEERLT